MAFILYLETATEICSVALAKDNELIDIRENYDGKSHATLLTVFVEELLKNNRLSMKNLDAVCVSMGPGSYTGLRIGVSAAKGLCYGSGLPLIAVPTLQSMVNGLLSRHRHEIVNSDNYLLCPMIDARRLEVYTALFTKELKEVLPTSAQIIDTNSFHEQL